MKLTNAKIKTAKPTEKDYKLSDGKGLFLLVKKSGGKYWRLKYRFNSKEKLLSIGVYPEITLAKARKARDHARELLAQDRDPMSHKKALKAARQLSSDNSFEALANQWIKKRGKKSESGDKRLARILKQDLLPYLGGRPISEIEPTEVLQTLVRIEERGALETARKARQITGQIFRYAVATGCAKRDPTSDLRGALKTVTVTHYAAITEPKEVGKLMAAIYSYQGSVPVVAALRIAPLLFCRPGELRQLKWSEVNIEKRQIELSAERMKTKEPHIIPLSNQAMAIIEDTRLHTGHGQYVFTGARSLSRPLSDNGLRAALRTMGYTNEQMTIHGFRAMARTILDEVLNYPVDWIEHQLAHAVRDVNGRAYNRTKHLSQRREMMQTWANYLDGLRLGVDNVVPFRLTK